MASASVISDSLYSLVSVHAGEDHAPVDVWRTAIQQAELGWQTAGLRDRLAACDASTSCEKRKGGKRKRERLRPCRVRVCACAL